MFNFNSHFLGLPGLLFSILDHELEPTILSNIHDTLTFIMHAMAAENLTMWLGLLREVVKSNRFTIILSTPFCSFQTGSDSQQR